MNSRFSSLVFPTNDISTFEERDSVVRVYSDTVKAFPYQNFSPKVESDGHLLIMVKDFDFYFSDQFSEYLNSLAERLSIEDFIKVDFVPVFSYEELPVLIPTWTKMEIQTNPRPSSKETSHYDLMASKGLICPTENEIVRVTSTVDGQTVINSQNPIFSGNLSVAA